MRPGQRKNCSGVPMKQCNLPNSLLDSSNNTATELHIDDITELWTLKQHTDSCIPMLL